MLETFCAAANIKALMRQETIPDALQKLRPLVDSFFGEDIKGVYMTDLLTNSGVNGCLLTSAPNVCHGRSNA